MSVDIELEGWRREWRSQAAPLPDLRAKVRRQDRRKALGLAALIVCLATGTTLAVTGRGDAWSGFASGLWLTTLLVGGYTWRVSRGAWRPSAQTTQAYLELVRRRALAQERVLRFAFRFLLVAFTLYAGFLALGPGRITAARVLVAAFLGLEIPLFTMLRRRNRRDREQAERMVEQAGAAIDDVVTDDGEENP